MQPLLTEGHIKSHPFLTGCSSCFLNHLEEFGTEAEFEKAETILREGEYADRCYLICEGRVELTTSANGEGTIEVQVLEPGDVLGWSWLYPPFKWHFTARALTPCKAIELNAASLLIRAEEEPAFGFELMKRISLQLVQRLQATRKRLVQEVARRKESS
jgi:CRP-like cAMP-binding protein